MKLLVLDVEGTLFETSVRLPGTNIDSTIWQAIAQALGPDAMREEIQTHEKWHSGVYKSYLDWMKDTIRIHLKHGLRQSVFADLISSANYNPGVLETLGRIDRSRYEPLLISGGFRELTKRAQVDLGIQHAFAACEYMFDSTGRLVGYNLLPCDFHGKIDFIRLMLREYGLADDEWVFIGDGANDVWIAEAAPLSIAYSAHEQLRRVATRSIESFASLLEILGTDNAATTPWKSEDRFGWCNR